MWSGKQKTIGDVIDCDGTLYQRLIQPLLLAALNTEPREGSAALAAAVIRETLGSGGRACRPLIARDGLANAFIDPALQLLATRNATVQFGHRLRAMTLDGDQVTALQFGEETIELAAGDAVILAVPPVVAASLLPGLETPDEFRAIVNAHFRIAPPKDLSPITGVVNGMVEWLFAFPDRLSVTISAADRLLETPRETLAEQIWREVAQIAGLDNAAAALADRARAARDLRRDAKPGCQAAAGEDRLPQPCGSPATGPPPDCRRPSKARSAPAIKRPSLSAK